ncbi:MAG: peptide chain release factor-like protein [Verrucomicrobia bacterium]|jgi:protein subunit release factor B|nr:peptide chain release factor-like protein [Verrucomicrobiota bacterium]
MPESPANFPSASHPVVPAALAARLAALGIREADLEESFVRSGGHGGQNVNKTSTCVHLLHRPSGLRVKCQEARQQGWNRVRVREMLAEKLEARRAAQAAAERARLEKLRREKRGRSAAAKRRILADKAHHAAKKSARRRVELE